FIKDSTDPLILAKKILDSISKPVEWEGTMLEVHISIGISIYPDSSDNIKDLIHCSDSAMYIVKQNGGNSYNY
ncbi:MAG: diguanylate cyclase domain-containing protein, partial [Ruminiclostridium sp.]